MPPEQPARQPGGSRPARTGSRAAAAVMTVWLLRGATLAWVVLGIPGVLSGRQTETKPSLAAIMQR